MSAAGARARSLFAAACAERLFGHPQEAAWAAPQVYDAADHAAQQRVEGFDEDALGAQPVVQEARAGIAADLETALAEDVQRLREQAMRGAATLASLT